MAARYTNKTLCNDIAELNEKLEQAGATMFLEAGSRYNYSAVDVLTASQWAWRKGDKTGNSGVQCTLETGTPRECWQKAETFYYQQLTAINRN